MTLEPSTLNWLLGSVVTFNVWTLKTIMEIKESFAGLPCRAGVECSTKKRKTMKKTLLSCSLLLAGGFAIACLFTGCAAMDRAYQQTPAGPAPVIGTNTTYSTNAVILPASTNAAGLVTQAATNQVITPTLAPIYGPAVVTLAPSPIVTGALSAVAALPLPFAGAAGIALGWLYTAYAAFRNKKLSQALVTGIEAGRQILQTTPEGQKLDAQVKDVLIQHQEWAGVLHDAAALVNTYTGNTVK